MQHKEAQLIFSVLFWIGCQWLTSVCGRTADFIYEDEFNLNSLFRASSKIPESFIRDKSEIHTGVPGGPLSPTDFRNAEALPNALDPSLEGPDPIFLAGRYQGDIVLRDHEQLNLVAKPRKNVQMDQSYLESTKWPNATIPYLIDSSFDSRERSIIAKAMKEYSSKTCLQFVPRTGERDYIFIKPGQGCSSLVGRAGGQQTVSLSKRGCIYFGIVIHEFMHASGFWHEHSRPDRDDHIFIMSHNIQKGRKYNFDKLGWNLVHNLGIGYDYGSVMHYSKDSFSKNGQPTIVTKTPNKKIGQRSGFSQSDIDKINELYQCRNSLGIKPKKLECLDYNEHCRQWALGGECDKNPTYMKVFCKISCKDKCAKVVSSGSLPPCVDTHEKCSKWQKENECKRNPTYMLLKCPKSCGECK